MIFKNKQTFFLPNQYKNVNLTSPSSRLVDCIRNTYFLQHVTDPPPRWSCIYEFEMINQLTTLDPLGASDHVGISFKFSFGHRYTPTSKTCYIYDKTDYTGSHEKSAGLSSRKDALKGKSTQEIVDFLKSSIMDPHIFFMWITSATWHSLTEESPNLNIYS